MEVTPFRRFQSAQVLSVVLPREEQGIVGVMDLTESLAKERTRLQKFLLLFLADTLFLRLVCLGTALFPILVALQRLELVIVGATISSANLVTAQLRQLMRRWL